jgi:hypothetical protein
MASTLLFIHGTGVRRAGLAASMKLLQAQAAEFLPGWKIEPCAWGEPFGAALNKHGASVPGYARSGDATASLQAQQRARWMLLADDPLIELRVAPEEAFFGHPPGPGIWARVQSLHSAAPLQAALVHPQLAQAWAAFIAELAADTEWQTVVSALTLSEAEASPLVARALVAAFQASLRERSLPALVHDSPSSRDALADALLAPLGGPPASIKDWLLGRMTAYARRRRGSLTDLTSPGVGDILRYQARGGEVRGLIAKEVQRTGARVLLAHSLGGIAAVDWLALGKRPIDALITVGSQAAYFYEIDALVSRRVGAGLPPFFPARWLNIHDPGDMLGYPAGGVFKDRVQDLEVDNGEPFPESHSAYFDNRAQVWPALATFLKVT